MSAVRELISLMANSSDHEDRRWVSRLLEAVASDEKAAADREHELDERLHQIGDLAHDASTGPAVPDVLWEIRGMAYGVES